MLGDDSADAAANGRANIERRNACCASFWSSGVSGHDARREHEDYFYSEGEEGRDKYRTAVASGCFCSKRFRDSRRGQADIFCVQRVRMRYI